MTRPDDAPVQRLDTPLSGPRPRPRSCSPSRPRWIYEAVRSGTVPCLRIGRHIRFTRTMLEEWLQGRVA
jgi:hypothetical protein